LETDRADRETAALRLVFGAKRDESDRAPRYARGWR
jgi:hypothetical protein